MIVRRCDRYLLRQMLGPFALALAGLALFILLNLILRLSELMVDRGIGIAQLLRLLILWMPELIAWAIPMAALFAVFLGLGRMEHDREIMALESIGVSLRRVLLPLLIAGLAVSVLTFAVYNWAMPVSKQAAQRTYREILFSQSVPRISVNTFFTGQSDQYFYVRQYDADDGSVHDVLIYDVSGQLFPQAESRITLVTADSGYWNGETWKLSSGRMYGFNREGDLIYSATFEELALPVGQTADQIWAQSKSPSEMGLAELRERITRARTSGLPVNESIVEFQQRFALPLSALLFVLVGGTVSLMFGSKSRSTGIIIGLVIIGLYQGFYFWMQALGRRGGMNPALAAWIPNLLFGALGLLLYLRVDRLASRDMWNRLRNRLPFLTLIVLFVAAAALPGLAQDTPLRLECDDLFVADDRSEIVAEGSVRAELVGAFLTSDTLHLTRDTDELWKLEASGSVALDFKDFELSGDRVAAELLIDESGARTQSLESFGFHGQSKFENSSAETHTLYFQGASGKIVFDPSGDVDVIEIRDGELTTCNCCDRPFQSQPYTLRAQRLLVYPSRMIVVFGLTGRVSGVSMLWLPVYVQPLEDTLESPLFPAFGRSTLRGWFLKWNIPFFVSESLYGSVLFDYYARYQELGGGFVLKYETERQSGALNVYAFPAVVGSSEYRLSLDHTVTFSEAWRGATSLDYGRVGEEQSFTFGAQLVGDIEDWTVTASAVRSWEEDGDIITERLPEISLSGRSYSLGNVLIAPAVRAGWVREWHEGELTGEAMRWQASLDGKIPSFQILGGSMAPTAAAEATFYSGDDRGLRTSLSIAVPFRRGPLSATYAARFVSGSSPFDFDQEESQSHLGWSLSSLGRVDLHLESGFDFADASSDPLFATVSFGDRLAWRATITYDLSEAAFDEIVIHADWSAAPYSASITLPFEPARSRFESLEFEIAARAERSEVVLSGAMEDGRLEAVEGALSIQGESGWGAKVSAEYDAAHPMALSNITYGVFRDIGDCLRVGLERGGGAIWIYASILAFPEAVLRYAPETARLQFGD